MMGFRLLLQPIQEVLDELLGSHLAELLLVDAESGGHTGRVLQPLLQERLCDVGQLVRLGVLQLNTPEVVEEDLVVEIEVALAFHQQRPGDGVEIVERRDEPQGERPLEAQKRGGRHGDAAVPQGVEKLDEHV
jgi:hypothetical protein